jgi:hypothetical protein
VGATVELSDGQTPILIWEVDEETPSWPTPLEVLPDVAGGLVAYQRVDVLQEIGISGRLKTKAEVETLEGWIAQQTILGLTSRDGTISGGWRVKATPQPKIQRKDGDSPDWLVTIRLWRMP